MENTGKKEIVFVCNTLFQIIVATHLRYTRFPEAVADIIISNHTKDSAVIVNNLQKTGVYRNVFYTRNKKTIKKGSGFFQRLGYQLSRISEIINNTLIVNRITRKAVYDEILISNISIFTVLLYNKQLKKNRNVVLNIFEEGLSTYAHSFVDADSANSLHRKWINKSGIINNVDRLYLFNPAFLEWNLPNGEIHTIPKINTADTNFINIINTIFNVDRIKDKYDKKIIFFEESHYADGFDVPDVELVNKIAEKFGKENIIVKIHPRNPVNRFAGLGYKTNLDTNIPWEVIVLNQDISDKILVTISSGSVIYPYLYFDVNIPSYSLLECLETKPGRMSGDLGQMMQKVYRSNPDVFFAPQTMDEFFESLAKQNI